MSSFKKNQAVTVVGTKAAPERRPGKYIATHPSLRGDFIEVLLEGSTATTKFRASQVAAA
ncbi:hypothetical protein ASF61_06635 [Duganella sp. Leaf126]|uniref:hypothetical protein n=1 Tax=Duganella sp. Leaf126 TaxID=1736266 RepID=UPI0006FFB499|nr:hypothetical protein [Duganella sp. Leaf126]KQQ40424.1 hypothetical protein ASF61_06635 [Duganella sp. Leaf126]